MARGFPARCWVLLPAVLVLGSGARLDAWRAEPVRTAPGYVREIRWMLAPSD